MDKPKYRYNWKTGKAEEIYRIDLTVVDERGFMRAKNRIFLGSTQVGSEENRQAQRKRNVEMTLKAERMNGLSTDFSRVADAMIKTRVDRGLR